MPPCSNPFPTKNPHSCSPTHQHAPRYPVSHQSLVLPTALLCQLPYPALIHIISLSFLMHSSFFMLLHMLTCLSTPRESNPGHPTYVGGIPHASSYILLYSHFHPSSPYLLLAFPLPSSRLAHSMAMSSQLSSSARRASLPVSLPYTQPRSSCSVSAGRSAIISASPACQFPAPSCTVLQNPGR